MTDQNFPDNGYLRTETSGIVALVLNADGTGYDKCHGWEAAQTYAHAGWLVRATSGDDHLTKDECQRMYDGERAAFIDCFGENALPDELSG